MATAEVKEEQKAYVCLPWIYDEGKHILSWALSHFPKDETKIVATSIIATLIPNHPQYSIFRNMRREVFNETLDKHVAQCAIQKFKADKLIHENNGYLTRVILELIELKSIKNLVMWSSPDSELIKEKANPSCKIWFIQKGNLIYTRYPTSYLTEATSEEIDPGLNTALHLNLETELQRREKLHQKEIEENQKRENKSSMSTAEVKEEQKVYVCLPSIYDEGKHTLSWVLSHFPKDETKIVATYIGSTSYSNDANRRREEINKTLDKHVAQCTIHKFKAKKLIHDTCADEVKGILELIDLRAIMNLVMQSSPNSQISAFVAEKANPSCKIWFIYEGNLLFTRFPNSGLTEALSEEIAMGRSPKPYIIDPEVKEKQKLYVSLPLNYDNGKHILSWVLNNFPKDETKIVATFIISTSSGAFFNAWKDENLDKYLAQCEIQKFKAKKLIHEGLDLVEGILELIDLREIKNLVMWLSPNSIASASLVEKANPSCNISFIYEGNLLFTRYPKSDLTKATSEEQIRREKRHQKEIDEIQKRENDKNDLLKREIKQLKLENQLLQRNDLDKQKQQLREIISDLEIGYNKLKQECNNAIKEAQQLRRQKEHFFGNYDMVLGSQFSLRELEQATENFSDSLKIGEGGFGCVYKGSLRKTTVAIKKLNSESFQGLSNFQQEVAILNRVRHPNIVNLIGSCSEISTLVYEFLPNGSLEDRLNCADNTSSLTWQSRTRIISEICLGLVFLHSNKPHLVIHGNLKPANILLDANLICKLSDFGISRIIKQSDSNTTALYHTTHSAGTFAYIDPQFLLTGELTPKSDVYSFGIIVLHLLTGKDALNIANEVQEGMRVGRFLSIVDKSAGKWPSDLAKKLAKLGLRCADISRKKRPDMTEVWATIEPLVKAASLLSVGSSTSNEEHIPSHFVCPIIQEIMKNPCIAADGFTYEAEAIMTWLNRGHNTSPMTNLVLPHHDLIPDHVLRSAIQEWLQQHPQSHVLRSAIQEWLQQHPQSN